MKKENKEGLIMIGAVIGLFLLIIGGFYFAPEDPRNEEYSKVARGEQTLQAAEHNLGVDLK